MTNANDRSMYAPLAFQTPAGHCAGDSSGSRPSARRLTAVLVLMAVMMGLVVLVPSTEAASAEAAGFELTEDGEPRATIVIAAEAPDSVEFAAEELQHFVERISGGTLPIARDTEDVTGPVVLVGESERTAALGVDDIPSGFTRELDEEGFVIRTLDGPNALVLAGNDGGPVVTSQRRTPDDLHFERAYRGSLFAVYELLERFGCRWYYPGEFGTVVPESASLHVPPTDDLIKPSFPVRGFWWGATVERRNDPQLQRDMALFMMRNKFLPYGSVLSSAGDGSIMRPFRGLFDEHPDYFALNEDGDRHEGYLCLSNPEVVRIATEYAIEHFEQNPESMHFGYAPPDGRPECVCEDCQRMNYHFMQKPPNNPDSQSISDIFYWFLNEVAAGVEEAFPDRWVSTTAYAGRIRPPEGVDLHENITAHIALLGHAHHHRFDFPGWQTQEKVRLLERWAAISPHMVERQYYPPMQFHCNVPLPLFRAHAYNVRQLEAMGMAGAAWEGRAAFKTGLLNYYVLGRMLWDTSTDIEAVLDEHYELFYGDAGERIGTFFDEVEDMLTSAPVEFHEEERLREIYPHERVVEASDAVGDIEAMVSSTDLRRVERVRFARLVIDHLRDYSEMRAAEAALDFATAAEHARAMIKAEAEIDALHPSLLDSRSAWYDGREVDGELGANASPHGKLRQYETKLEMTDGTRGELVAALPLKWEFRTDPRNEGLMYQWYLPEATDADDWHTIETTRPWETQGYQDDSLYGYDGYAWYRTRFDVPAEFEGRRIKLFVGGVNNEAWAWVSQTIAGHLPHHEWWQRWMYHGEIDITDQVEFGATNELTLRVHNDQNFGGLFRRSFVYSPNPSDE